MYTYQYLPWREITSETFKTYNVFTKVDAEGKPISVGFRYPNGDTKVRLIDEKKFFWVKGNSKEKAGLFGRDKFAAGGHKYVTITEGEADALSLYQVLRTPVVSVQSASTAATDCTTDRAFLDSFERVYLAFDNDASGRDATAAVARLFEYGKVFVVKLGPRKDANEWLQHAGGADQLKHLWWNSKKYLPENIHSELKDFKKILSEERPISVPYPFKCLNDKLYGMRKGETVLIKAPEKVGKTEVMHFFEHQLLEKTNDRVGAFFLEEPAVRNLQALAGISLQKPVHLPDSGISELDIYGAVEKLVGMDERLFIYSHFGSADPNDILNSIRFLVAGAGCGWILVDHLAMVCSALGGKEDERRTFDYISTRLEMMVKELNFGLIIVTHVNDEGQTRGSRYPTKVFDTTLDFQRDLMSNDPDTRNIINISIPFNRYPGITGYAGSIKFDRSKYTFVEVANDNQEGYYEQSLQRQPSVSRNAA